MKLRCRAVSGFIACLVFSCQPVPAAWAQGVFRINERHEIEIGKRAAIGVGMDQPIINGTLLYTFTGRAENPEKHPHPKRELPVRREPLQADSLKVEGGW